LIVPARRCGVFAFTLLPEVIVKSRLEVRVGPNVIRSVSPFFEIAQRFYDFRFRRAVCNLDNANL
jgi:hypothetical protein